MSNRRVLSVFTLTMINVAAIASLRNLPFAASYGFSMISVYVITALLFFVPSALVSAELATTFPETGGIYTWVKEAFGPRVGFLAIWLQFIENVIWFPTALSFTAGIIAYFIDPALVQNKTYMIIMILTIYWFMTLINLKGMKASGMISSLGAVFGTILPGFLIISLGIIWYLIGKPIEIPMSTKHLLPKTNLSNLVFIAGVLFGFAGIEMSAVHAKEVHQPNKNYPKAILISACVILALFTLGSLSIAIIIPKENISLVSGVMEAFMAFFVAFKLSWFTPVLAALIAFGTISQISTWLIGPVKGIYATAEHGMLPKWLQKRNKEHVPWMLLIVQGVIVSGLALIFLIMPDINSSFWLLSALAVQLYTVMYFLMFIAAIYLRYKKPNIDRPYKVFGGNVGMWLVGGIGFMAAFSVFLLGFIPPEQIDTGTRIFYDGFLILGLVVFGSVPFWITPSKKRALKRL